MLSRMRVGLLGLSLALAVGCGPDVGPTTPEETGPAVGERMSETPEPTSDAGTTPVITELCWDIVGPSGGFCGDRPLPDEVTTYRCLVRDDDGDALTVRITFHAALGCLSDRYCWTESGTFDPRASREPVSFQATRAYPYIPPTPAAVITCEATDARGREAAPVSVCFGDC